MGKTIVVTGGNSGIGLESARQLAAQGHHLVLLGRDAAKGQAAVDGIRKAGGSAEAHVSDLATHAGVRAAAEKLAAAHPKIDALILGAGHITMRDERTADGLHPVFSVNYLHRYHLTQGLLPQLRAGNASVVMLVAGVPLNSKIDFAIFPKLQPFPGMKAMPMTQIANYHYLVHLAKAEPTLHVAATNVGLVKTDIMRDMPPMMRFGFNLMSPLITIPVSRAAANPVKLSTSNGWTSGQYWPKPGKSEQSVALTLDPAVTQKVMEISKELTGC